MVTHGLACPCQVTPLPTRLRSTAVRILGMRWIILSRPCGTDLVGNYTQDCVLG
jgi:hypothetical protein